MKASKFSESQIAYVLRQAEEGTAIAEVCRSAGISEATFYNWRKDYNEVRPHSAIGNKPPISLLSCLATHDPS